MRPNIRVAVALAAAALPAIIALVFAVHAAAYALDHPLTYVPHGCWTVANHAAQTSATWHGATVSHGVACR